jgi:hypothetical protein
MKLLNFDGKPGHSMVDDRFAANPPVDQLPHLAWFGIYCATNPAGHLWNPDEGPQLDAVESDLVSLCGRHGNGWAAYVHRLDTPGLREYYVYFGNGAAMERVLPELKAKHETYRLEFDQTDDVKRAQYRKWLGWVSAGG